MICDGRGISASDAVAEFFFHGIDHVTCHLWGKDAEIVGKDDEQEAPEKAPAVFPEIFIDCLQMLQRPGVLAKLRFSDEGAAGRQPALPL